MRVLLLSILIAFSLSSFGQFYPLEAGFSGGISSGMNFRAYLDEDLSYEALLSFRNKGAQFHLLRQEHMELEMTENGNFYFVYGYGAHLGFYYTDHYTFLFRDIYYGRNIFSPLVGIDGYAALEFRFQDMPLSVGLSFKPYMEISLRQVFGINLWDFGLTVKYRFKPENDYY